MSFTTCFISIILLQLSLKARIITEVLLFNCKDLVWTHILKKQVTRKHTNRISCYLGTKYTHICLQTLTWAAPGVSSTKSGNSLRSLSNDFSMSPWDKTGPQRSASSLEVSSRWLALASRASATASEGTTLRIGPRFSSASSSWKRTPTCLRIHGCVNISCFFCFVFLLCVDLSFCNRVAHLNCQYASTLTW